MAELDELLQDIYFNFLCLLLIVFPKADTVCKKNGSENNKRFLKKCKSITGFLQDKRTIISVNYLLYADIMHLLV